MIDFILKTIGVIALISVMTYFFGGIVIVMSSIIGGFWFGWVIGNEYHNNFMMNEYLKNQYKEARE